MSRSMGTFCCSCKKTFVCSSVHVALSGLCFCVCLQVRQAAPSVPHSIAADQSLCMLADLKGELEANGPLPINAAVRAFEQV